MSSKLEGIGRLERKLEEATANFNGELDYIKTELTNLSDVRQSDKIEINRLQASINNVSKDLQKNEEVQSNIERKIDKIDNTSNKNLERINKLEESNARLCENMKLLEEREKRRSLGAKPKVLETLNSDKREETRDTNKRSDTSSNSASNQNSNLSYS